MSFFVIALVALLHLLFLVLEMFMWEKPLGKRVFGMTSQQASETAVLAKNQGLYNGILAAGLIWSFFIPEPAFQRAVQLFFLSAISIAGIYGAATAKPSIFFIQALPALIGIFLLVFRL